jgi:hypothetical protein
MGCGATKESISVKKSIVIEEPVSSTPDPTVLEDLSRPKRPQPQVGNVENFVVVWLDAAIDSNVDTKKSKEQLQKIINVVKTFADLQECHTFINTVKDEKIFLIVSSALGEQFVPIVQDAVQVDSIYIFCSNKEKHENYIRSVIWRDRLSYERRRYGGHA